MAILRVRDDQDNWVQIPYIKGDKGDQGDPGYVPEITSTVVEYQLSNDGQNPPDTWLPSIPSTLTKGMYFWSRVTIVFDSSTTIYMYGVTYIGTDGVGSGDMESSQYDPDGDVATAGSIPLYVTGELNTAITSLDPDGDVATAGGIPDYVTSQLPSVPSGSSTTPAMDGVAAAGSETTWAHGDHVHPTDTSRASATHVHGDITNSGTISETAVTPGNGDYLVILDSSDSNKIVKGDITFDGTTTTQALTPAGTFETFIQSHQDLTGYATLASPTFTGTPEAPTATAGTNNMQIATTAFVQGEISSFITATTTTAEIETTDWVGNVATVSATGVTASSIVLISPDPTSFADVSDSQVYATALGSGTITFGCTTTPTSTITMNVLILG